MAAAVKLECSIKREFDDWFGLVSVPEIRLQIFMAAESQKQFLKRLPTEDDWFSADNVYKTIIYENKPL